MNTLRRLTLELDTQRPYASIPLDGGRDPAAVPWRAVISLQPGGHMGRETEERLARRRDLFNRLGVAEERVYGVTQTHSQTVVRVEQGVPADYFPRQADGLITARPWPVLSVTAADCLPIFLFHAASGVRALVHSGWRGTGIVLKAWDLLINTYGVVGSEIRVVIGPGIGPCCYAVPAERYRLFTDAFGQEAGRVAAGMNFLDLRRANLTLLEQAGAADITVVDDCTCCQPLLGSFRRDGKDGFHTMLALFGGW